MTSPVIRLGLLGMLSLSTFGCGGSSGGPAAADPLTVTYTPYDTSLIVTANAGGERLVDADFRVFPKNPFCANPPVVVANCFVNTCRALLPDPTVTPIATANPGALNASSPSLGNQTISLTGGTARVDQIGDFGTDEAIRLNGGGTDVGTFDRTFNMPADITAYDVDGCNYGTSSSPCVVSSAPIVSWTGGSTGARVTATLSVPSTTAGVDYSTTVTCNYPSEAQRGRIPPEALAKLPAGAAFKVSLNVHAPLLPVTGNKYSLELIVRRLPTAKAFYAAASK